MTEPKKTGSPIEIASDADVLQFTLPMPPTTCALADGRLEHRSRTEKARAVDRSKVDSADHEALDWLVAKKGIVDFGKPYKIQKFSGFHTGQNQQPPKPGESCVESVPHRLVGVEVPIFNAGLRSATGYGATLREAVEDLKRKIPTMGPHVETYPERNRGLDASLFKVGSADFRVADLLALIRDYYDEDGNVCGGSLHCSLDDGNVNDHGIESDGKRAQELGDRSGHLIAELLKLVPEAERKRIYDRGYGR